MHYAFHDALTGLPNRDVINGTAKAHSGIAKRRQDRLFAVLFLDLDRFQVINISHLATRSEIATDRIRA